MELPKLLSRPVYAITLRNKYIPSTHRRSYTITFNKCGDNGRMKSIDKYNILAITQAGIKHCEVKHNNITGDSTIADDSTNSADSTISAASTISADNAISADSTIAADRTLENFWPMQAQLHNKINYYCSSSKDGVGNICRSNDRFLFSHNTAPLQCNFIQNRSVHQVFCDKFATECGQMKKNSHLINNPSKLRSLNNSRQNQLVKLNYSNNYQHLEKNIENSKQKQQLSEEQNDLSENCAQQCTESIFAPQVDQKHANILQKFIRHRDLQNLVPPKMKKINEFQLVSHCTTAKLWPRTSAPYSQNTQTDNDNTVVMNTAAADNDNLVVRGTAAADNDNLVVMGTAAAGNDNLVVRGTAAADNDNLVLMDTDAAEISVGNTHDLRHDLPGLKEIPGLKSLPFFKMSLSMVMHPGEYCLMMVKPYCVAPNPSLSTSMLMVKPYCVASNPSPSTSMLMVKPYHDRFFPYTGYEYVDGEALP